MIQVKSQIKNPAREEEEVWHQLHMLPQKRETYN